MNKNEFFRDLYLILEGELNILIYKGSKEDYLLLHEWLEEFNKELECCYEIRAIINKKENSKYNVKMYIRKGVA